MNANWQTFVENGLPSRKNENWKYDDIHFLADKKFISAKKINIDNNIEDVLHHHRLRSGDGILLVMVNGYFMRELSDIAKLPQDVIAINIKDAREIQHDTVDAKKYPFAKLNETEFSDGLFLKIPDDCKITSPIHLLSLSINEDNFIACPRNVIMLGKNSEIIFLEEYFSSTQDSYLMNVVTSIYLEEQSSCHHYKIQCEGKQAAHIANHFVHQQQNSYFSHMNFSCGGKFARDDVVVKLLQPGASCKTSGFYHLHDNQQTIDNHVDIHHQAPLSQSEMLYKGIMENQSRAIFNGRLHVEKDAQKITAYQANHNLLLSKEAEVYSKPELEIYADDVKCKHGATTGQLDEDALFYMRSRGISQDEAQSILLQGFAEEIISRISHEGIRMRVQESL